MSPLVIVCLVIVVALGVGYVVLRQKTSALRDEGIAEVTAELGGDGSVVLLEEAAVCLGTESGPFNNKFGMGALGVSADTIYFLRWAPRETLEIARADVIGHQLSVEHLGQNQAKPVLQVTYRNEDHTEGETPGEDVVAWKVEDPEAWIKALD